MGQRIDKWLVYARMVKTRAAATELVERGRVRVNRERVTKTSQMVGEGDVLTLAFPRNIRIIRIVGIGERRGPPREAQLLYEDLTRPAAPGEG